MCCIPICLVASGRADTSRHLRMPCTPVGSESSPSKSRCVRDDSSDASARLSQTSGVRTDSAAQCRPRRLPAGGLRQHRSSGCCLSLGGHIPHPFARDCTTNPAPTRYGRRMVRHPRALPHQTGQRKIRFVAAGPPARTFQVALPLAAVVVVGVALRTLVWWPSHNLFGVFEYDDGVYYAAARLLLDGYLPYSDFSIVHPPGVSVVLLPAAVFGNLFGDPIGMVAGRVEMQLVVGLNRVLVYRLAALLPGDAVTRSRRG